MCDTKLQKETKPNHEHTPLYLRSRSRTSLSLAPYRMESISALTCPYIPARRSQSCPLSLGQSSQVKSSGIIDMQLYCHRS